MRNDSSLFSRQGSPSPWRSDALVSVVCLLVFLAWDFFGRDMQMAKWWGQASGFPLRDNWWLEGVLHKGARHAGWVLFLSLFVGIWRPWGSLRNLATAERAGLFLSVLSALLVVILIKGLSQTSCPWDLQVFGGSLSYISHWDLSQRDGEGGHCFPAGHASTGFAFMAAYFSLRDSGAPSARKWLACAMLTGLILGVAQQIRGAHFMSHTLWSAWLCWSVGGFSHWLFNRLRGKF